MDDHSEQRIAALETELTAARNAEQRMRRILDQAPVIVYLVDPASGEIMYANQNSMFPYAVGGESLSLDTSIHPDDRDLLRRGWQQAARGESVELSFRLRNRNGDYEWVQTSPQLFDDDGSPQMLVTLTLMSQRQRLLQELSAAQERSELISSAAGLVVYEYDVPAGTLEWSGSLPDALGYEYAELNGVVDRWADRIHPDDRPEAMRLFEIAEQMIDKYEIEYRFRHKNGHYVWLFDRGFFLAGADGKATRMIGMMQDISARKHAELERLSLQEQIIEAQQAALRELNTPLIPISADAVVMPLIGAIDSNRAQQMVETLLTGVEERRAHTAILDITGVSVVDTQVANALLQAAQAVRLLGARVILTGIRPEVAQTLVGLGADMSQIDTRASLQDGIAAALRKKN